jgi:hypothetical protein
LDKSLISSEKRLNKTIRLIAVYRKDLARLIRRSADWILDTTESPELESPDQCSAAA